MTTDPRQMTPDELNAATDEQLDVMAYRTLFGKTGIRFLKEQPDDTFGGAEFGADRQWYSGVWWDDDERMPVPSYSTRIADAWELVEKMRECTIGFFYATREEGRRGHFARFDVADGSHAKPCEASADTAPRAITIAAIMAKRELTK